MYRLLNSRLAPLHKLTSALLCIKHEKSALKKFEVRTDSCVFNKLLLHGFRFKSTSTNLSQISKKASKRKKSNKKYYDVLVVTNNSAKQQKANVQKLTWNDIELLSSTNLNLSELYKLKHVSEYNQYIKEHTYNNLAVIDNSITNSENISEKTNDDRAVIISDIPEQSQISELPATPSDEELLFETTPIPSNAFQPEIIDESPEDFEPEYDNKVKEDNRLNYKIAQKTLASYIETCWYVKDPMKGLRALNFHNMRATRGKNKRFPKIRSVKVYNAMLKCFAAVGDVYPLEEIVGIMKNENIKFNVQSYIAILECFGRANVKEQYLRQIRTYTKEAISNGFTFDRILNEGIFTREEHEIVLNVMKKIEPNYKPSYELPVLQSNNHLINHLNHESQLREPPRINEGLANREFVKRTVKRQLELEKQVYVSIKNIVNQKQVTEETLKYRKILEDHFKLWEEAALKSFRRDFTSLKSLRTPLDHEPYMRSIPVKDFVTIIVNEAKRIAQGSESYSPTVNLLYKDLGNKVYARYKALRKQRTGVLDKVLKIHTNYCEPHAIHRQLDAQPTEDDRVMMDPRQEWQWAEHKLKDSGSSLLMDHQEWPPSTLIAIGKFLYHILMHDLQVDANAMRPNSKQKSYLPAFYSVFRYEGRISKEEVKPHPAIAKLYRAAKPDTLTFPANELPMLCLPIPWTSISNGGYLVAPCEVIRLPSQATLQRKRLWQAKPEQLYPSFDALNQLAAVPWRINTHILDLIIEIFNDGGSAKLNVPESPDKLPPPPRATPDMSQGEKYKVFKKKLQHSRKKAEMYSLWCDCLYRLSMANHFREDVIWLPHNMDFRGRVYPIPPHLNHLGSDLARSMLHFAESRPLGPEGLNWLKLHLINLTGLKKRDSIKTRIAYADEILDDILDSADNPLTGRKWWAESDEPWQTLACCMEIARAIRSGDPENYRSHFPVHQDGSCNGLQHYAALGRDSAGGYSVNLCPSELPQDVYSAVVELVEEQRKKDAIEGNKVAQLLEGFVKRKVIKQTIMTTVYGVTRFGARLQIEKQLKDIDEFPKDSLWAASMYLTGRTFDCLRTMFMSTREIQDWLTNCARQISSVAGCHVEWVTPLGLPIVQPYIKYKSLGTSLVYKPFHMDEFEKPNVMKQKNAFPPNFIHSLDSTHMMLTSLHCQRAGITFVSVHDCYWTHPSTVHIMNQICREQFVALHSEPLLEDLSMFLFEKYAFDDEEVADDGSANDLTKEKMNKKKFNMVLRNLPKKGDLDIMQVLKSVYFFS